MLYDLYKKSHTPFQWHKNAFATSKKLNVTLFSTPLSIRAVDFLERFKVPLYKIASLEITDFALIKRTAKCKKPIVISTGCASINEINNCINLINNYC